MPESAKWGLREPNLQNSILEKKINNLRKNRKHLSAHLHSAREEERNLIASELHDTVGQALTALKMDLFMLEKHLPQDQEKISRKIKSMNVLLDQTIHDVRNIYTELRPPLLDLIGLEGAVLEHFSNFQNQTKIKGNLEIKMDGIELNKNQSTALYRIIQEALNNIKWHSQATHVKMGLSKNSTQIKLIIEDNGLGINVKELSDAASFGLIGMKERADFLQGKLEIKGVPDKGTILNLSFPI